MKAFAFKTTSTAKTRKFGEILAKQLQADFQYPDTAGLLNLFNKVFIADLRRFTRKLKGRALVMALFGDLGSGKTTFSQGFIKVLARAKKLKARLLF